MRDLAFLFVHLLVVICRLTRPGGVRSVMAESVLVKHQLLILKRSRKRAPNLRSLDRIITGLCALLMRPARRLYRLVMFGVPFPKGGAPWQSRSNPSHFGEGKSKTSPALLPMSLKISGTSTCRS